MMSSPVATLAVPDSGAPPASAVLGSLPGLQLLLRILPFRHTGSANGAPQRVQLARPEVLEELHRHPLAWYGSTAAQWPGPRSNRSHQEPLPPAEVESALLAYVRMAAEAEQQPQGARHRARRSQMSSTDIAAELHALYTLAAVHVAQQQDREQQSGGSSSGHARAQPLSDCDLVQLLKAYASLEDSNQQPSSPSRAHKHHTQQHQQQQKAQAAAAALEALYAFARLADAPQQQELEQQQGLGQQQQQQNTRGSQQQQQHQSPTGGQAPGQLQVNSGSDSSNTSLAYKQLAAAGSRGHSSGDSTGSSTPSSASGDLQVLLKLAQLGLQTS